MLGFFLYAHALQYEFIELDDPLLILENPAAQSFSLTNLKIIFTTYDPELYIPLTFLSYQLDSVLGGLHPFLFHLHNLLHHILNAWLFLVLAYWLCKKREVALFAGLLFLLHPIQVEAVLWISGRKDLLSTTFFLLSLLLYLRYLRKEKWNTYAGSVGMFLLGLLAKVSVISLPLLLFLIDWIEGRLLTRRSLMEKLPYIALALIFGIIALYGKIDAPSLTILERMLIGARSLVFSVGTIVWPFELSPMYADAAPITIASAHFLMPLIIVLSIVIAAMLMRRRWKAFAAATAFVIITFAPSFGNLVKGGEYYITADRYAYIPSMAVFLLVALGFERVWHVLEKRTSRESARKTVTSFAAIVLALLFLRSLAQTRIWSDTLTLSRYVTQVSPTARLGHVWYGNALRDAGKPDDAIQEYDIALAMKEHPQTYYNRGLAFEAKENLDAAMADYRKAIALEPVYPLAHINLGRLLYLQNKKDDARREFTLASEQAPQLAMPYFNLGVLAGEEKDFERAIEYYRKTLERDPAFSDARGNVIAALLALGKTSEAIAQLRIVLEQDPGNEAARELLRELTK